MKDAYFTVEAALVLPIVLATVVFLMYTMFFQYDRCLMEQDMGMLLLRGSAFSAKDAEERVKNVMTRAEQQNADRYIMWELDKMTVRQEKNQLLIGRKGSMKFPFAGWQIDGPDRFWVWGTEYKSRLLSPASFVRSVK